MGWMAVPCMVLAFTLSKFDSPESMVVDPEDGSYYVSNLAGSPTEKDSNGYISKISSSGNIVIQKFIGGKKGDAILHSPKGLALSGNELFVADIDTIKVFNKKSQKLTAIVDLSKHHVKFLNDLALDAEGDLYVTDMFANRIFKIKPKKAYEVTVYKGGPLLSRPNGLLVNPRSKNLMVATFDPGMILEIDSFGGIHILKKGLKGLDGMDYDREGNLYVSSFEMGEIYKIERMGRGPLTTFLKGLTTPTDIAYDRKKNELLIPSMKANTVTTISRNDSKL
ncbi:MAG: SMP-30/gluconolactonase/LRE family protein [Candidatus Omnitrophica bacterium]|nr:SMP-30/gluconolactonase/LRE family protein [Candidatus Omnitrophota bacterium]